MPFIFNLFTEVPCDTHLFYDVRKLTERWWKNED